MLVLHGMSLGLLYYCIICEIIMAQRLIFPFFCILSLIMLFQSCKGFLAKGRSLFCCWIIANLMLLDSRMSKVVLAGDVSRLLAWHCGFFWLLALQLLASKALDKLSTVWKNKQKLPVTAYIWLNQKKKSGLKTENIFFYTFILKL